MSSSEHPTQLPLPHEEDKKGEKEGRANEGSVVMASIGGHDDRPPAQIAVPPHRFIRLHPRFDRNETLRIIKSELPVNSPYPVPVKWLFTPLDENAPSVGSSTGPTFISSTCSPSSSIYDYYALPGDFSLQSSTAFAQGRVYGQDISSGAAVMALLSSAYDARDDGDLPVRCTPPAWRVLDLCCAPGLKLCAMADFMYQKRKKMLQRPQSHADDTPHPVLVGVDVSENRIAVCKRVLQKYQIKPHVSHDQDSHHQPDGEIAHNLPRIRLYCNDGTTFGSDRSHLSLVFDSWVALEDQLAIKNHQAGHKRQRQNKSAKARERKRLRQTAWLDCCDSNPASVEQTNQMVNTHETIRSGNGSPESSLPVVVELFDRVLVDAECSTDGSWVHVQKRRERQADAGGISGASELPERWRSPEQLQGLMTLQRRLASSGFRLLKPGGFMVYSTCSMSENQNEGIVRWMLEHHPSAKIVPLDMFRSYPQLRNEQLVQPGSVAGTIRLLPHLVPSLSAGPNDLDGSPLFGGGFFLCKITKVS